MGSKGSRTAQPWSSLHRDHDMGVFLLAVCNQFYRKTALLVWIHQHLPKCIKFTVISQFCCGWNFYFLEKYISRGLFSQLLKEEWFVWIRVHYLSAGFSFRWFVTPYPNRRTLKVWFELYIPFCGAFIHVYRKPPRENQCRCCPLTELISHFPPMEGRCSALHLLSLLSWVLWDILPLAHLATTWSKIGFSPLLPREKNLLQKMHNFSVSFWLHYYFSMVKRGDNPDILSLGTGTGKGSQPIRDTLLPLHSPALTAQFRQLKENPHAIIRFHLHISFLCLCLVWEQGYTQTPQPWNKKWQQKMFVPESPLIS